MNANDGQNQPNSSLNPAGSDAGGTPVTSAFSATQLAPNITSVNAAPVPTTPTAIFSTDSAPTPVTPAAPHASAVHQPILQPAIQPQISAQTPTAPQSEAMAQSQTTIEPQPAVQPGPATQSAAVQPMTMAQPQAQAASQPEMAAQPAAQPASSTAVFSSPNQPASPAAPSTNSMTTNSSAAGQNQQNQPQVVAQGQAQMLPQEQEQAQSSSQGQGSFRQPQPHVPLYQHPYLEQVPTNSMVASGNASSSMAITNNSALTPKKKLGKLPIIIAAAGVVAVGVIAAVAVVARGRRTIEEPKVQTLAEAKESYTNFLSFLQDGPQAASSANLVLYDNADFEDIYVFRMLREHYDITNRINVDFRHDYAIELQLRYFTFLEGTDFSENEKLASAITNFNRTMELLVNYIDIRKVTEDVFLENPDADTEQIAQDIIPGEIDIESRDLASTIARDEINYVLIGIKELNAYGAANCLDGVQINRDCFVGRIASNQTRAEQLRDERMLAYETLTRSRSADKFKRYVYDRSKLIMKLLEEYA